MQLRQLLLRLWTLWTRVRLALVLPLLVLRLALVLPLLVLRPWTLRTAQLRWRAVAVGVVLRAMLAGLTAARRRRSVPRS